MTIYLCILLLSISSYEDPQITQVSPLKQLYAVIYDLVSLTFPLVSIKSTIVAPLGERLTLESLEVI